MCDGKTRIDPTVLREEARHRNVTIRAHDLMVAAADEIERLRAENRIRSQAAERHLPCPGHRDKTERDVCYICRIEVLRSKLRRLLADEGAVSSPNVRASIKAVLERTGVSRESAF